ncbi:type III pantothenate kinase [Mycoplasmoides alvi]|uniref:type III pantothenate kinase n=1 Tax=Mycoplasmoides alvi TaxID=78580 RepID=UPI00051AD212|nr:type III pantothenate kinase [Mycoplasmoides alvi]
MKKKEKNVLVIDIGNSYTKFALFNINDEIFFSFSYPTKIISTKNNFLFQILKQKLKSINIDSIILGSVVPKLNSFFIKTFKEKLLLTPHVINKKTKFIFKLSSDMKLNEIGNDILAFATYCAFKNKNVIGFSFGTALVAILINNNVLKGVSIVSGLKTSLDALVDKTALINIKNLELSKNFDYGHDTLTALNSGIYHFKNGFMSSFYNMALKTIKSNELLIILTGFEASNSELNFKYVIDKNAILIGYYLIHKTNNW